MDKIIFFDLETGGLDPFKNPILSIGACITDLKGNLIESHGCNIKDFNYLSSTVEDPMEVSTIFNCFLKPDDFKTIDPESLQYNKLEIKNCEEADSTFNVLSDFISWVKIHSNEQPIFANWALLFDLTFLYVSVNKQKLSLPLPSKKSFDLKLFAKTLGYNTRAMINLYENFNGPPFIQHDALEDTKAAAFIYKKICEEKNIIAF